MKTIAALALLFVSPLIALGCASSASSDRSAASAQENREVNASYENAIRMFQTSASGRFFEDAYGFAIFPTIGKGGVVALGASHGKGRVYVQDRYVGDTALSELSIGPQLGGQAFSEIIFFEDQRAFEEFTSGSFEFGASAQAVAITAGAKASASTVGSSATASGGSHNAVNAGVYGKGFAVFTIAKGGLMYEIGIAGQKFTYIPRDAD